ncbi:hypothetical protein C7999DRAFT_11702 [Corynascus novoguineensis]|uniref:Uncharacterized protein n=1 Tax=Corynascus novoguineensis TaxID=1126955 RepID=A0AAN7D0L1_9PEZI|nr:hypothetical protein C7999DRAFT_11702 [Corynascus novoguineensis]
MCIVELLHYKCDHTYKGKVGKCRKYFAANVRHFFLRGPADCGNVVPLNQGIPAFCFHCSVKRTREAMGAQNRRRAQAIAHETEAKKRREQEAFGLQRIECKKRKREDEMLRWQKMERERGERGQRKSREQKEALRQERAERAERAERERNNQPQGTRDQARAPFISSTSRSTSPISRDKGCHLQQGDMRTLSEPWLQDEDSGRDRQVRPQTETLLVQAAAAWKPVVVKPSASGIPRPSRMMTMPSGLSIEEQRRPGNAQQPPIPPKNPWHPQHPNMAPAPLNLPRSRPKGPEMPGRHSGLKAAKASQGAHIPLSPSQRMKPPNPAMVQGHANNDCRSRIASKTAVPAQQQKSSPISTARYKPNPMFANRQGDNNNPAPATAKSMAVAPVAAATAREAASSLSRRKSQKTPPDALDTIPPKEEKKRRKSWIKKVLKGADSDESIEWVSQDAARIERGE